MSHLAPLNVHQYNTVMLHVLANPVGNQSLVPKAGLSNEGNASDLDASVMEPGRRRINATKILVMAHPRTGSSYTGILVASAKSATYWHEPLFRLFYREQLSKAEIARKFTEFLDNLLNCREEVGSESFLVVIFCETMT